jgi:hypothetical protein
MKVRIEIDVTPQQRLAIGNALLTWKPAPEEGVRCWAEQTLQRELNALEQAAAPGAS